LVGSKIARASLYPIDLGALGADFQGGVCYFDDQREFKSKITEVACAINPFIDICHANRHSFDRSWDPASSSDFRGMAVDS